MSYGDTSCLPMGGISHSGFEFMFSTLGQMSHYDAVSHIASSSPETYLPALASSNSTSKQVGQEEVQLGVSCSLFVRTMPERAVYPGDPRSPTRGSLHLFRIFQILVPRSTRWQGAPVLFSGSMRNRNQTCSRHS